MHVFGGMEGAGIRNKIWINVKMTIIFPKRESVVIKGSLR